MTLDVNGFFKLQEIGKLSVELAKTDGILNR